MRHNVPRDVRTQVHIPCLCLFKMKDVQKSLRKNHDLHPYLIDAIKKKDNSGTHGKRTQTES